MKDAEQVVRLMLEFQIKRVCAKCEQEVGVLPEEPGVKKGHGMCRRHAVEAYRAAGLDPAQVAAKPDDAFPPDLSQTRMQEDGMESWDYSPEDLQRYQELKAHQLEINAAEDPKTGKNARMMDQATGDLTPEWKTNYAEFEKLRNRYNGMPPKQLAQQMAQQQRKPQAFT